jgi:hypothetical protein
MEQEQPSGDSAEGLLERLGNALLPEPEAVEASPQVVENSEQPEEPEAEEAPEDDGFVDLELEDGETVRVPPKLKDGYLRQSDYTRKTQELASLQKQAQASLQQQAVFAQFQEQTREDQQKLLSVDAELQRYKQLDWTNLDTDTYIRTRGYIDQLRDQKSELEQGLGEKRNRLTQTLAQQRQAAAQNAYEYIGRHVKDWSPDSQTEKDVAQFAGNFGIPREALAEISVMFPGFAVLAHKAAQYEKLQAGKGAAVQKAQKAPPVVKPGAVTSNPNRQREQSLRQQIKKGDSNAAAEWLLLKGL